jgi:hypothetical protein
MSNWRKAAGMFPLVMLATLGLAQTTQPSLGTTAARRMASSTPAITYVDGQLKIAAFDISLAEILRKVAELTGATIDVPPGANSELIPIVKLGPGPARTIVASLLTDSSFDYLIQATESDPDGLKSILLMVPDKKPSGTEANRGTRTASSPYARVAATPPAPVADVPPSPPAEETVATTSETPAPEAPTASVELAPPPPRTNVANTFPSDANRPGALSPPVSLDSQSINNQLQQMYQQRMQMVQQDRQSPSPGQPR